METRTVAVLSTGCFKEQTIQELDKIIESTYEEDANPNFTALVPMEGGYMVFLLDFVNTFFLDHENEGLYEVPPFDAGFEAFLKKLIDQGHTYLLIDRDGPVMTIEDMYG